MNCKPGDLAVTTGMVDPQNNDVIVEVESLARNGRHGVVWNIKHRTPMLTIRGGWACDGEINDCNLRPISGVPVHDEQHAEVAA